jgi:phospholipid/cholesterol/gamma-HCH transport system ATP-binding protein
MPAPAIIELDNARALQSADELLAPSLSWQLLAGELALIEARNADAAAWFADLCCGLVPLSEGTARFVGHDWAAMPDDYAAALRGQIGRVFATGGWVGFLDTATNILLPQLHHSRATRDELNAHGTRLACGFGLPGLPLERPGDVAPIDLARCACVRAFIGDPLLVLLESPLQGQFDELLRPLLNALADARHRGAAAIWLTRNDLVWSDRSIPADHRLRLREHGLLPARRTE